MNYFVIVQDTPAHFAFSRGLYGYLQYCSVIKQDHVIVDVTSEEFHRHILSVKLGRNLRLIKQAYLTSIEV